VTRGTKEPYRMFTSRAEYRLMLREDNADIRLMETGHELGLVDADTVQDLRERKKQIAAEISRIKETVIRPLPEVNDWLAQRESPAITNGTRLDQILKRAGQDYSAVDHLAPAPEPLSPRVVKQVEIEIKYEGYIERQVREIERFRNLERVRIPENFDYDRVHNLSNELREKLRDVRPASLGQASRIDGMTPSALSILMITIKAGN